MPPDVIIVVAGMGLFVVMFWVILASKLNGTMASPLRIFYPFKIALRRILPLGDYAYLSAMEISDSPVLFSQHSEISGYYYSLMTNSYGATMLVVHLKSDVDTHVVAVGRKSGWASGVNKFSLQRYLTPMDLEGDYAQHFTMFCTKGKELELLQLFDPADMAYFMDFCKAYNFEVYKDSLYISQAQHAKDATDSTTLVKDAQHFLRRNEKLLARI